MAEISPSLFELEENPNVDEEKVNSLAEKMVREFMESTKQEIPKAEESLKTTVANSDKSD